MEEDAEHGCDGVGYNGVGYNGVGYNVIKHLLSLIPYKDLTPEKIELPPRQSDGGYVRPPTPALRGAEGPLWAGASVTDQTFVPEVY